MEANRDVQNEGWVFNRENHYPLTPASDGHIYLPENILRMDVYENAVYRTTDLVKRGDRLYDKLNHTFDFDPQKTIYFNIVWLWDFEDLPSVFKRYITYVLAVVQQLRWLLTKSLLQCCHTRSIQPCCMCRI